MSEVFLAEPPTIYPTRAPLVVDASLLAACVFGEMERDAAEARLRGFILHAPGLIDYELTNVAVTRLRRNELTLENAVLALAEFSMMELERHAPVPEEVATIASRYRLTAYDAAYLWLAGALKAPLATFDRQLANAASDYLGQLPAA
ncbi:MAG: type II toxin-antitoxin system VapC family toxin [Propionivibrio sp.]|uniref:type II toxin-antitoxin system VapC family toxin n=1 Tax=Propionivibrio sp. TaxID=2212460 RepID=UPI001A4FC834|nr:type II toxin-antitoxin system VapC family toxin [Propionivibrio sp.]MBL8415945.1 type II toxin-antitoxin system VapC family toxin [Propionivibrio sp.]